MGNYTGFKVKSSYILGFQNLKDVEIFHKAHERGKVILISKDSDFAELISRMGSPPKLINLRIGNCDNVKLWNSLKPRIKEMITVLTISDLDIIKFE